MGSYTACKGRLQASAGIVQQALCKHCAGIVNLGQSSPVSRIV